MRVTLFCLVGTLFALSSCTPQKKEMNNTEIMSTIQSILKSLDPTISRNLCPEAYEGGTTGGCFGVKEQDDIVAATFYDAMQKKGFTPEHRMRQDYAVWSGSLYTPMKNSLVIFNVRTVADVAKETGFYFKAKELGYQCVVTIDLMANTEKKN